jgi:transcriptional regulator with XRE-family HTH domain
MNTSGRKESLREALSDKEYRDAFVAAQATVGIPFQIRALREKGSWTQQELATKAGMKQSWVSKIESPGYSGFSLKTLLKLASVFDVGLVVRFVPVGELVEWELNLSNDSLSVPSFEQDPYFESAIQTPIINAQEHRVLIFDPKRRNPGADSTTLEKPSQGAFLLSSQEKKRASALR